MSRPWTILPHFCGKQAVLNVNLLGSLGLLCAFLLSGCGESSPHGYAGSPSTSVASNSSDTLQPLIAPPHSAESPPALGMTDTPKSADGLPLLQAKGANTNLFSQKLSDEDARFDRLENAVQELRNDYDAMSPAIVRLVSIEGDIQNLLKQLEVLTGGTGAAGLPTDITPIDEAALDSPQSITSTPAVPLPPTGSDTISSETAPDQTKSPAQETLASPVSGTPATPETAPAPPTVITPPVAAQASSAVATAIPPKMMEPIVEQPAVKAANGNTAVQAFRLGEHPGKVRIVLDISGKTAFTADLDNSEKILVVELPQAAWNAKAQESFSGNPVIDSYKTESMGKTGTRVIIKLKGKTSIAYKSAMGDTATGGSKVVIDLTH